MFVVQGRGGYVAPVQTTLRATGPLPADEAWERYADLDRWSHWAPQISGVSVATPGGARRLRTGMRRTRTWLRTTGPAPVVLGYAPLALVALHSLLLER